VVGEFVAVKVFEISGVKVCVVALTSFVIDEGEKVGELLIWVLLQLVDTAATAIASTITTTLELRPPSCK
jgi:hypothetical protein